MDREKVIKGLEHCKEGNLCYGCPYDIDSSKCIFQLHDDVLALIKEQDNCENCAIAIEDRQFVVRCKDCKHILPKGFCHKYSRKVTDDFFCADGERRTDNA